MTKEEFKKIFDENFAHVRNYVFYRSGNTDVANDVAQETFLKIWEKKQIVRTGNIKGLLFKIAGNLFVSAYRKEKRSFEFFNHFVPDDNINSPEEEMAFEELKNIYKKAVENMPEKQRTVFLLSRIEEMKNKEIAEVLGISVKAVEKRMTIALKHLRKYIRD